MTRQLAAWVREARYYNALGANDPSFVSHARPSTQLIDRPHACTAGATHLLKDKALFEELRVN